MIFLSNLAFCRQHGFRIADVHYDFQIPHRFIQKKKRTRPHTSKAEDDTNVCFLIWINQVEEKSIDIILITKDIF